MGILDNLKNVLGGKKAAEVNASTTSPSQILRDNGLDPSELKFTVSSDGSVTVKGNIKQETDRKKIAGLLQGTPGIRSVIDHMTVASVAAAPEPETGQAPPAAAKTVDGDEITYIVKSGDTLWKIAAEHYGEGSKYLKIFAANTPLLKDPDHIFPGQKLVIPAEND